MKILVTGGAGFIGSNFIHYWLELHPEDEIVNLDKLTYAGNLQNLSDVEDNPKYTFIQGDICDADTVEKAIVGVDKIVHFAAESHVDRSILGPAEFIRTNVVGTQVLLDAAVKHKIKHFHHVSTDEVFGQIPLNSGDKFNEMTLYDPRSPYSASKASSDHLVRAYQATYELPITITNCSNNYGPYQYPEKLISLAITNLLEGKKIPVYKPGNQIRDWLYVTDHCRAIDLVLNKGKVGETYCVGGMVEDLTNLQVVKKITELMGKSEDEAWEFVKDRPGHDVKYAVDWSKIRDELGWEPENEFDQWLQKTIDWYRENEDWWKPLKNASKGYFEKQYGEKNK